MNDQGIVPVLQELKAIAIKLTDDYARLTQIAILHFQQQRHIVLSIFSAMHINLFKAMTVYQTTIQRIENLVDPAVH